MLLYTNGCSYTHGVELQEPQKTAWPYVLGKKLNFRVINEAELAGSNVRAYRKTLNFVFNNLDKINDIFIIIGWPPIVRFEESYNNKIRSIKLNNSPNVIADKEIDLFLKNFFRFMQYMPYCYLNSIFLKFQLHTILIYYHIPHIFFDVELHKSLFNLKNQIQINYIKNAKQLEKTIPDKYIVLRNSYFDKFALLNNYKFGPEDHPLEEAHEALANLLYDKIQINWKEILI